MSNFYSLFTKFCLACFVILNAASGFGQVRGCKDPMANNYNAAATMNDGSCVYNITVYNPPVKVNPMDSILTETSGLQMADNYLWSFNDGGGAASIYRIDTITKTILQTVRLQGAENVDWEDISYDGTDFYIGDFGNNANGARTNLKIYKFPIASIPDYHTTANALIDSSQIEVLHFTYSDQQSPVATTSNHTKFDCEAMIVDNGKVHLFTKNWIDLSTTHYVIDGLSAGSYIASPVDTLQTGYLVTGADKTPGQQVVALLGYQNSGFGNHFMHLLSDYSGGKYFNGNKRKFNLPDATVMGQAEGVAFRNDGYGYISNEKFVRTVGSLTLTVTQKLKSFDFSEFIPQYVLPLQLVRFSAAVQNEVHKLSWSFVSSVRNLQIQYSTNGIDFTNVKAYSSSIGGSFLYKTINAVSYYRLAWRGDNGGLRYSNVLSLKNKENARLGNFLLKSNGDLYFSINSVNPANYSFKLTGTDGKLIANISEQSYKNGSNRTSFSRNLLPGTFVFLTFYYNGEKNSALLQVER